nr:hypothetical protein [Tanacetum cinerariifolium]
EEESFDPIPITPEGSEDESNDEEDLELRLSEEARIQEDEEADELYRDVNINQGRGLQVTQNIEDSHVTLTPVHPDGPQESSSVSSFVTSMLNPISDAGVESIFTTASSPITTFSEYRQTNLFVDVVSAIPDKAILDTYGESTILKRRREDDDQEGPFAGSDRGSKRQKEGREHAPASTPSETATGGAGKYTTGSQSRQMSARDAQSLISALARQTNARSSFNELLDTPIDFFNFIMNRLNVDTLTPVLLAGLTYELIRGSCTSLTELEYHLRKSTKQLQISWIGSTQKTDWLQDFLQREYDEFLCNIDENMKKLIKGQVKSQVKEQVLRILPRIKESVNATLEAEVLTRSSHSSRTSYAIAADLSEMELKNILIEKMEGNKSIQRSDEQRNLYKALVEAYDADKTILDTYGESTILKRRREDDNQEGPSAGSDRGSNRQRQGGEHASASTPSETATGSAGRSTTGSQSRQISASESAFAEEPVQTTCQMEEPSHSVFETGVEDQPIVQTSQHSECFSQPRRPPSSDRDWNKTLSAAQGDAHDLERQTDARSAFNELLDTPIDFSNFIMNRLNFYGYAVNRESALDVYSKRRIIAVTELKIMEWHDYKHLDWISVRRDDDQIYKFKEGDFKRLCLQDIEDMLLLLVQGKLSNLTVEEHFAFNVSLRMFARSIVIQRRVEVLQLGVESVSLEK